MVECNIFSRRTREYRMRRLEALEVFVAVVDKGSLTAAARQLGRSLQSVGRWRALY
jgi:hypothetical protein